MYFLVGLHCVYISKLPVFSSASEWSVGIVVLKYLLTTHSNDSHQCPILAADFVIFYYGIENEEAIQAGAGSE